jgi:ribose transport system substrate-binding protein
MMSTSRTLVFAPVVALSLVLGGCTAAAPDQGSGTAAPDAKVIRTIEVGSHSDEWVQWDPESCEYVVADEHPDTYVAELRSTPDLKFALGEQSEALQNAILVNESVMAVAEEAGIDLIRGNYDYPSTTAPVSQGDALALQQPDGLISYLVLATLLDTVNQKFADQCAPVLQVTVPWGDAPVFGLSNPDAGQIMGSILADWATEHDWTGPKTDIVVSTNASYGADVVARMDNCRDAALEGVPDAKVHALEVGADPQTAQTAMTNWLTAHPDSTQILVCSSADSFGMGLNTAFDTAGRADDGAIASTGGTDDAVAKIKEGSAFVGTVDQDYPHYGDYLVPLMQDILAGRPVPKQTHQTLHPITAD